VDEENRGSRSNRKKRKKVQPFRLRVRIVAASWLDEITPKEIAVKEGLAPATVYYYFGKLEQEGWIYVSRTERVRGGTRRYYRAARLKLITDEEFEQMSDQERYETSEGVLMDFLDVCKTAHEEGTLDEEPDSHLSQTPMDIDRKAWEEVQSEVDRTLERCLEIMVEGEMRLRKEGGEAIPTVVALAAFRIPASITEGAKPHHR
jgi:DNA-binding transcriptional ArsR family regulator